ncbi:hypothetical protein [Bacillus sp. M6-12]|uniref:hypothetical protein n=1 Tax=Bacillus sp. M6-12 TaxID=2054166 RepID=UPI00115AE3DD|nr:hypothetical protein [Bacillus sp. M6-12]
MAGSILFNMCFSLFGFILYFLLSFNVKFATRSAIESLIVFLVFFVLSFLIRWMAGYALALNEPSSLSMTEQDAEISGKAPVNDVIQNLKEYPASPVETEKVMEYVKNLLKEDS